MDQATGYVVSTNVIETIETECRRHPNRETGGILMGLILGGRITVTHATGPGITWDSSTNHFSKDTDYVQSVLDILHEYSGVNYLGVWHKHPHSHPRPSSGDVSTAMDELADDRIGLEELLTPICFRSGSRIEIIPYVIRQNRVDIIEWVQVAHRSLTDAGLAMGQWYRTPGGHQRLLAEIDGLKECGAEVEIRGTPDQRYQIRAKVDHAGTKKQLVFLCPDDYPVGVPDAALVGTGHERLTPLPSKTLGDWNICRFLRDVVVEFVSSV